MFTQFLSRLHNLEIRIRKAVSNPRQGNFHSVFKGSGLDFSDLRQYQYGDDVRAIDWNSSAKGHGIYVKLFKEEKEQTVFFLLDVSGSQLVGNPKAQKIDLCREICGVLTLAAVKEASLVGLQCFSDQSEQYFKPSGGMKQAYRIISGIYNLEPASKKTNISRALLHALEMVHRRSVVFLISDFVDAGYELHLKAMARKHDLIVIHVFDKQETAMPVMGIIPVHHIETGVRTWINTSSPFYQKVIEQQFEEKRRNLELICRQNKADYICVNTSEDFVPALIRLFRVRRYQNARSNSK
jgi:uncharacterized protein (DUF58 family)